ncbi:DUF4331 family protein [Mycolicibacterium sp.]|uniref:DUF4331 family protein n=1 Tax=Mycolicibacterium sp. TaxID=2320850 RepID=UPI003D0CEB1B
MELDDPRLDMRDLYVFPSPKDPARTVLILTVNPDGGPLYPAAVYRLAIDHSGDYRNDIAFSFVFGEPEQGPGGAPRQRVDVLLAVGTEASSTAGVGSLIFGDIDVSFTDDPHVWRSRSGSFVFFAGARADPTRPDGNIVAVAVEVPTGYLGANPDVRIWGRCSVLDDGTWRHVDRIGHPGLPELFVEPEALPEYRAGIPNRDRDRWMGRLIEVMAETGGYPRDEAIEAIAALDLLPDVMTYDPAQPAKYPNGRALADDVAGRLRALLAHEQPAPAPPCTDFTADFPYLGAPR